MIVTMAAAMPLYDVTLALVIGLGPLFILCLLFKQAAPLFQKWLLYGIGTVFSLAVLSIMVTIAMKMLAAVTVAYVAPYVTSMAITGSTTSTDGLNSMALQQGGIGLILTTLLIAAPPMAAAFFQGTLEQANFFRPFGRIGEGSASSRQPMALGAHPHPAPPPRNSDVTKQGAGSNTPQIAGSSGFAGSGDDTVKQSNPNTGGFG